MTAREDTLRDLESEVGVLIRRVRRVIGVRARAVHDELQPASYLILTSVEREGPVRASAISEQFDLDKGAVSRHVKHLISLGLLADEKDPADARATLLTVTDEARTRLADVVAHRQKGLSERLAEWSDEELAAFVGELSRYNTALNATIDA
ncbi:MarR family transcriptional regulator [Nocardioides sp. 1609]|uniref:MarR family winged helix-turn-helix transcriptional regulator n=1 Tax=Nocardioides sp. 1609 TaxID=2508327 RepID=UPI00106FD8D1|nr:MarR family transcriptional regulator [Nocardioides sp. 1609]